MSATTSWNVLLNFNDGFEKVGVNQKRLSAMTLKPVFDRQRRPLEAHPELLVLSARLWQIGPWSSTRGTTVPHSWRRGSHKNSQYPDCLRLCTKQWLTFKLECKAAGVVFKRKTYLVRDTHGLW